MKRRTIQLTLDRVFGPWNYDMLAGFGRQFRELKMEAPLRTWRLLAG